MVAIPPLLGGFFGLLLALCLTPLRWPARAFLAVAATGAALAWVVSLAAFWTASTWVPWSALAWPFTLGATGASALQGWRHLRHNQMVTQAFGQYVSPDVLDWLKVVGARALDPSEAERREVAVLFSDVAGYTSLSNRLPPADIMRSLRLYLDAMVPIVQKHGGYLDKINGDGLMVLFGAPRSIGDHSQAAVACAIEMQHKVRAMQAEWEAITGGPLTIRVGVATGHAFVGNLGAVGHIEYTAIGRVVNLAARLEPKAPLGGVALCASTVERLPRKPEGDWIALDLKGYEAGAVKAWAVEAEAVDAFEWTKPD